MDRRTALAALAALAWPLRVAAQQRKAVRTIGYVIEGDGYPQRLTAELSRLGYVDGRNLRFIIRRIPSVATRAQLDQVAGDLAHSEADILFATKADPVIALHNATTKIPIVTGGVSNPVALGLARSLARPGKNVTGLSFGLEEAAVLQMGALRALRPGLKRVVFLLSESDPHHDVAVEHRSAAAAISVATEVAMVKNLEDVERVFASMGDPSGVAAWIAPLPGISDENVAAAALSHRIVTHGIDPRSVRSGILLSYWISHSNGNQRIANVIDKIFRGVDPAEIPFELPDKVDFVLNRTTAKAVGATITADLLLRATEVIG